MTSYYSKNLELSRRLWSAAARLDPRRACLIGQWWERWWGRNKERYKERYSR